MTSPQRPSRPFLTAQAVAMLLALGFLRMLFDPQSAASIFLDRTDVFYIFAILILTGTGWWLLSRLWRKLAGDRFAAFESALFWPFLWIVLVNALGDARAHFRTFFPSTKGLAFALAVWGVAGLIFLLALAIPTLRRAGKRAWSLLPYTLFLELILFFNLLFVAPAHINFGSHWTDADLDASPSSASLSEASATDAPPVIFLILDMVGFEEVFDLHPDAPPTVAPDLPAIASLATTSTLYADMHAGTNDIALGTSSAMSRFFLQQPEVEGFDWATEAFAFARKHHAPFQPDAPDALYPRARSAGRRTLLLSAYLPWLDMIGPSVDIGQIHSLNFYAAREIAPSLRLRVLGRLYKVLAPWTAMSIAPVATFVKVTRISHRLTIPHYLGLAETLHRSALRYLSGHVRPGDFAVLHQYLPHEPFVVAADGTPLPADIPDPDPAAYREQLRYANSLLGEAIDTLRASGAWDSAWVIFFSDHGVHAPTNSRVPDRDKTHIPFLVKAPGQTTPAIDSTPAFLWRLDDLPFAAACFGSRPDPTP